MIGWVADDAVNDGRREKKEWKRCRICWSTCIYTSGCPDGTRTLVE